MNNDNDHPLPENVIHALMVGSKIEAIKLLRIAKGLDLKTSKEQVERYMEQNQQVFGRSRHRQDGSSGRFIFVVVIIALAYTAYRYINN